MDLVCERCRGRKEARAARCERCDPCWEALLDGRWLGPITRDELLRILAAHAAGRDALVWRSGTEAWSSACEIPEIAEVLGLRAVAPARPSSSSPLLESVAARVAREREIEVRAQSSGRIDLGALVPAIPARPTPPPLPSLQPAPFPARPAPRPRPRAEMLAVGALLGGGLVAAIAIAPVIVSRLRAPDATTAEPGRVEHTMLDDDARAGRAMPPPSPSEPVSEITPHVPSEPEEARVALAPPPAPRAPRVAVAALAAAPPAARETPAPPPAADAPSAEPLASADAPPDALVEVAAVATPSEDVPAATPDEPAEPSIDSLLAAAVTPDGAPAPGERPASTPAPAVDALPSIPSRDDVERAIARAHTTVAACGAEGHGLANVRITAVGATGRVTSALVEGPLAGTPAGSCVARAVRQMELPRFTRDTFTLQVPFRI